MARQPFYEVGEAAYLFPAQSRRAGDQQQLEEPVRQWCAYELIRAYGFSVRDLEFERPVRVGSIKYRIDILILQGGVPWAVVECKQPQHAKSADGLAQAISYADAQDVQAEFAVYTNGQVWQVKRRIDREWVAVPDLPQQGASEGGEPLSEVLRGIRAMAPLLHKLDEPVAGKDAKRFLEAMQGFFVGSNLLTQSVDQDLRVAIDNLLRVLVGVDAHLNYRLDKLETARKHFEAYRKRAGFPFEICPITGGGTIYQEMQHLDAGLMGVIERARGVAGVEVLVLRVGIALLEYGRSQDGPSRLFPVVGPNVHQAIRDYLSYAVRLHLNASLPDTLDRIWMGDVKEYCRPTWEELGTEEKVGFGEGAWLWVRCLWARFRFWKWG